jgi:hypothetical protein
MEVKLYWAMWTDPFYGIFRDCDCSFVCSFSLEERDRYIQKYQQTLRPCSPDSVPRSYKKTPFLHHTDYRIRVKAIKYHRQRGELSWQKSDSQQDG